MDPHRSTLSLALDPGEIMRRQGIEPDPWQRKLLFSNERQVLLNCSRQAGKSTTVAALALHTALFTPGSLTLILSPSQRQSGELFRKVISAYGALGHPLKTESETQTKLELQNKSRIVCLPGREETIRSFSGVKLLIIDEAARVADDLYRSVRPMLATSQGRLVCMSTPFGKRGFFWQEWEDPDPGWHKVRITWKDCPRITDAFIAAERKSLGSSWVSQEYECSFESLEGLVYPDFAARVGTISEPYDSPRHVGGIDFGFRNPFAAVWGFLDRDGVLWVTGEHYERERSIYEHAEKLPPGVTWYADPAGAQEIAVLRKMGLTVRKGNNDIRAGIAAVHARVETGRLKVVTWKCPNLMSEATLYRYPTRKDGKSESEVPVDDNNHALGALRYVVARLDDWFVRRYRKRAGDPTAAEGPLEEDVADRLKDSAEAAFNARPKDRPWLRLDNEMLWE